MDIAYALTAKWPDCLWRLNGSDYENLEWLSTDAKPTLEQLESAFSETVTEREAEAAAKEAAKASALAKLQALGLTADEAQAIAGI
jgi:hypothetical protein